MTVGCGNREIVGFDNVAGGCTRIQFCLYFAINIINNTNSVGSIQLCCDLLLVLSYNITFYDYLLIIINYKTSEINKNNCKIHTMNILYFLL